ncbi:MAG: alpha/beta fold hydrolase [Polyangiaceae bacterium]
MIGWRLSWLAAVVLLNAACSDEDVSSAGVGAGASGGGASSSSGGGPGGGGGAGGGPPVQALVWEACPLYLDQPDGIQAECAVLDVPLRWSEPDGETIGIFVQRLRGTADTIRGQVWLLEGGPGGSGADWDSFMETLRGLDPTLDYYTVDHRGVGRSARLGCPQEGENTAGGTAITAAETEGCRDALVRQWGDGLAEFSTTAAARDLGALIDAGAQPGQAAFVIGVSYGTYWAHRYLQLFPEQSQGVVLDSIAPPGESFVHYDTDFNAVGQDFLELCGADALCSSKLGADPWAALVDLSAALEGGHCPQLTATWGLDAETLPLVLAQLLLSPETRTYIPALVHRYARCEAWDVDAIDQLLGVLFGGPATESYYDQLYSTALFYNVSFGELWPDPGMHPTAAEIEAADATVYIGGGLAPSLYAQQQVWPAYADDEWVDAWAEPVNPLLMLNGDLDPQTPIWLGELAAEHLSGATAWFVRVPRSAHAVIGQTPVPEGQTVGCGLEMVLAFLEEPSHEPSTDCLAQIPEESFTGDPELNAYLLGTTDLWENDASARVTASVAAPPHLERALREVRRHIRAPRPIGRR